ncbi:MAG: hypothetical protein H6725_12545 [Sandaracinaceae bacterium]|nr:hypothetical protein [Sandaracinaceae bacterium]
MKKLLVPVICALVGCAAGVAMPAITAQSYGAPAPAAQRWENYCAFEETADHVGYLRRDQHQAEYNQALQQLGAQGWEIVGTIGAGNTPCFRRPLQ